jgi:hypothetical protein
MHIKNRKKIVFKSLILTQLQILIFYKIFLFLSSFDTHLAYGPLLRQFQRLARPEFESGNNQEQSKQF